MQILRVYSNVYALMHKCICAAVMYSRYIPLQERNARKMEIKELIQRAIDVLPNSYAPYSNFRVAAALLTKGQKVYTGCNIENAAFSPTNCAERTAFFKAVSEGEREFDSIVIVGGKEGKITDYCPPCGVCRQVMMEFCNPGTFRIILAKSPEDYKVYTLEEFLPEGFGPGNLL